MASELKVDTISEKTTASGVTIDGVKLKDSAVEVDTISESTSGSGVTIDSVLLQDGNVDGVDVAALNTTVSGLTSNPAFTIVDFWAMNGDRSGTGTVTSWTDVGNSSGRNNIGSSMSHSSGIFTFPETGYYLVELWSRNDGTDIAEIHCDILGTTNNSSYSRIARSSIKYAEDFGGHRQMPYVSTVFDVTSTSNCKIRFDYNGNFRTYNRVRGNGTLDETNARFTKVGDT